MATDGVDRRIFAEELAPEARELSLEDTSKQAAHDQERRIKGRALRALGRG